MQSPMNIVNVKTDIFVHVIITKMTLAPYMVE